LGPGQQPGQGGAPGDPLVGRGRRGRDAGFERLTHEDLRGPGWWRAGNRRAGRLPACWLPGAVGRELADDGDVGLVDEERPGQRRLAADEDVAVHLVEPERVDRLVALQVGLLVDGELEVTGLDLRRDLRVEVERGDLRLAVGVLDRVDGVQRDRCAQREHEVDAGVLLHLRGDRGAHRRQVRAVDVDLVVLALERGLRAGATGLELHLALELHDAEHVLEAVLSGARAAGLAGQALVRAEVGQRPRLAVLADAGVDRLLHGGGDGRRVGQRDRDAVDLAVDGALDERRLLAGVGVGGVLEVDVVLRRGRLRALADDVPERVARRAVRHHRDRDLGGVRLARADRVVRTLLRLLAAGAAAAGQHEGDPGHQRRPAEPRVPGHVCPPDRWGVARY